MPALADRSIPQTYRQVKSCLRFRSTGTLEFAKEYHTTLITRV